MRAGVRVCVEERVKRMLMEVWRRRGDEEREIIQDAKREKYIDEG